MKKYYTTKRTYKQDEGEINNSPSQTIQGETYTLKELLQRFAQGQDLQRKQVHYFDPEHIDHINSLFNPGAVDLTDLDALRTQVNFMSEQVTKAIARQEQEQEEQTEIIEATEVHEDDQPTE